MSEGNDNGHDPLVGALDEIMRETTHPAILRAQQVREPRGQATDRQRALAQAELAVRIEKGQVDVGPKVSHMPQMKDTRDQRDPQRLGEALLQVKQFYSTQTLAQVADKEADVLARVENFKSEPVKHWEDRQRELETRAAEGDKFAIAVLNGESLAEDPVD